MKTLQQYIYKIINLLERTWKLCWNLEKRIFSLGFELKNFWGIFLRNMQKRENNFYFFENLEIFLFQRNLRVLSDSKNGENLDNGNLSEIYWKMKMKIFFQLFVFLDKNFSEEFIWIFLRFCQLIHFQSLNKKVDRFFSIGFFLLNKLKSHRIQKVSVSIINSLQITIEFYWYSLDD